jgi:uncharacterized protein (UPF0335 family)
MSLLPANVTSTSTSLNATLSMQTESLYNPYTGSGAGHIAFDANLEAQLEAVTSVKNEIIDYIRLRLGYGMIDIEADKEHFDMGIKQALIRYRQKSSNSVEESYAFLDLYPETQEYILPNTIMNVRAIYRRGIGSVSGTTASQFEPFATGYLNTYMLVGGRVGGLASYELFSGYQELAMRMFGGYISFTWNKVTKKLTLTRKIPYQGAGATLRVVSLTASGTVPGSTVTFQISGGSPWAGVDVGSEISITNCPVSGYNGTYTIVTRDPSGTIFTCLNTANLGSTAVTGFELASTFVSSPSSPDNAVTESVMLHIDNYKPDIMLLNDPQVFPWIQDYAYALTTIAIGQAREKFASIAGPQGGTTLNGTALKSEGAELLKELDEQIKNYADGGMPLTWITG